MRFVEIADGLYQASVTPGSTINIYYSEGVLFDAGMRGSGARILAALARFDVSEHALTHAHPDHQGASAEVCTTLGIPLACGRDDVSIMESGDVMSDMPVRPPLLSATQRWWMGAPHPVSRALQAGDEVGGFVVLETPGHSPGHVTYFRERDGVAIIGDVLNNKALDPRRPALSLPPRLFTPDPAENRRSVGRIAELDPAVVCFGHGPVLRDGRHFREFCRRLP